MKKYIFCALALIFTACGDDEKLLKEFEAKKSAFFSEIFHSPVQLTCENLDEKFLCKAKDLQLFLNDFALKIDEFAYESSAFYMGAKGELIDFENALAKFGGKMSEKYELKGVELSSKTKEFLRFLSEENILAKELIDNKIDLKFLLNLASEKVKIKSEFIGKKSQIALDFAMDYQKELETNLSEILLFDENTFSLQSILQAAAKKYEESKNEGEKAQKIAEENLQKAIEKWQKIDFLAIAKELKLDKISFDYKILDDEILSKLNDFAAKIYGEIPSEIKDEIKSKKELTIRIFNEKKADFYELFNEQNNLKKYLKTYINNKEYYEK